MGPLCHPRDAHEAADRKAGKEDDPGEVGTSSPHEEIESEKVESHRRMTTGKREALARGIVGKDGLELGAPAEIHQLARTRTAPILFQHRIRDHTRADDPGEDEKPHHLPPRTQGHLSPAPGEQTDRPKNDHRRREGAPVIERLPKGMLAQLPAASPDPVDPILRRQIESRPSHPERDRRSERERRKPLQNRSEP